MAIKFHCVEKGTETRLCGIEPEKGAGLYTDDFKKYRKTHWEPYLCRKCIAKMEKKP